jgi:hypothetical protein
VSQKQTLQQSNCDHVTKVLEWEYVLEEGQMYSKVASYGCINCDAVSDSPFLTEEIFADHSNCKYDPCFGCKAKTLQLNAGDATRDIPDKKWTAELKEYKKARDEGLRPAGTTYAHIEQARAASETLGTAYNAETMPKAQNITKKTAEVMKEIGQI